MPCTSENTVGSQAYRPNMTVNRPLRTSLARVLAHLAAPVVDWLAFHRQRRRLTDLDDRMLRDIGISRADATHLRPAPRRRR